MIPAAPPPTMHTSGEEALVVHDVASVDEHDSGRFSRQLSRRPAHLLHRSHLDGAVTARRTIPATFDGSTSAAPIARLGGRARHVEGLLRRDRHGSGADRPPVHRGFAATGGDPTLAPHGRTGRSAFYTFATIAFVSLLALAGTDSRLVRSRRNRRGGGCRRALRTPHPRSHPRPPTGLLAHVGLPPGVLIVPVAGVVRPPASRHATTPPRAPRHRSARTPRDHAQQQLAARHHARSRRIVSALIAAGTPLQPHRRARSRHFAMGHCSTNTNPSPASSPRTTDRPHMAITASHTTASHEMISATKSDMRAPARAPSNIQTSSLLIGSPWRPRRGRRSG